MNLRDYEESYWKILINGLISRYNFKKQRIGIQTIGSIVNTKLKAFEKVLSKTELKENYSISDKINDLENCDFFIIVTSFDGATVNTLERFKDIIDLQNKDIIGVLIV